MSKNIFNTTESMLLYFAAPALTGFAIGWQQAGFGQYMSKWASVVQWVLHFETFWLVGFVSLFCVNILNKKHKIPRSLFLLISLIITILIVRPIYFVNYELMVGYAIQSGADLEGRVREFIFFAPSLEFFSSILTLYMHDIILWPIFAGFIIFYGKFPFGILQSNRLSEPLIEHNKRTNDRSQKVTDTTNAFLRKLKPELGSAISYLKAEGHYVRTKTELGEDLIYYRFGDAIIQLDKIGIQVHRSYWVSHSVLKNKETQVRDNEILLSDGTSIPVGSTFVQILKDYS